MNQPLEHYYGDIVRYLFMTAAVVMLITLPLFRDSINMPLMFSIIAITLLVLAAGFTNPKQLISAVINLAMSVIGLVVFLTYAVQSFTGDGEVGLFFLVNLLLGLCFLFTSYFGVKTVRGLTLYNKE